MDSFYPAKSAAIAIGEWSDRMCKDDAQLIKMGMAWPTTALNNELVTIKELEGRRCAKAMFPTEGLHRQEAVFTIVGALKAKELPPVKASRQHLKYARQHATLVGWDAPCFKKALENMQEAAYTMYSAFGEDTIEPWRPDVQDDRNTQISSDCRYFHQWPSHNVAHCFDNDVMYMVFKGDEYVEKDPGTFKTGDIVEMGFAMVAWKRQGKHTGPDWSCMLVLRTLTFLDGKFTKDAHFAREAYKAKLVRTRAADDRGHADNHIPKRRMTSAPDSDDEYGASTSKRMHMLAIVDDTMRNSTPAGAP
ncbi:hypothetical protein B0H14DRAFT_3488338 [Mycena olivaceomarginata]|nr:hypothetical protein B0H14DRAFT_3488338 [Mycena olivaceomarginata]